MQARGLRRAAALFAFTAAAALGGCSDTTLPSGVAGNYGLTTVNGHALPYVLPGTDAGVHITLLSGTIQIKSNGDFDQLLLFNTVTDDPGDADPGNTRSEATGSVTGSSTSLSFHPRLETGFTATVSGNQLTYTRSAGGQSFQFTFTRTP